MAAAASVATAPRAIRTPAVVAILALAAVCRLAPWGTGGDPSRFASLPDSGEYQRLAENLAAGHGFSAAVAPPYQPDLRRTPVYPVLLAGAFLVTRHHLAAGLLLNVGLGVATVAIVLAIGRRWFSPLGTIVGAVLLATDLTSIAYGAQLLTEATFTCALAGAAYLGVAGIERARAWRVAVAGATLGIATLCRPIGLLLGPALAPLVGSGALWRRGERKAGRDVLVRAASLYLALNVAFLAVVLPWIWRNETTFGVATISSIGAVNMYFHRAAFVEAAREGVDVDAVRDRWQRAFDQRSRGWSEAEKVAWLNAEARAVIRAHPGLYARLALAGVGRMFGPDREAMRRIFAAEPSSGAARALAVVEALQLIVVYGCALAGTVSALRDPRARLAVLAMLNLVAYFVLIAGPEVYPRFRAPLMPFLAMVAGHGIGALARGRRA